MNKHISHIILNILLLTAICYSYNLSSQDPIFSNINFDDTYVNPANSFNSFISETKANFDLQFRDQWSAVTNNNTYATIKLQADVNLFESDVESWNGGVLFVSDNSIEGFLTQTSARIVATYTRKLSGRSFRNDDSHFISAGFSYGFSQMNTDYGALWFGRQYDTNLLVLNPDLESGEILNTDPVSFGDINFGLKWTYVLDDESTFISSFGVDHINRPAISNTDNVLLNRRYTFQFNAQLSIDESISHIPNFTFINQGPFIQAVPGYKIILGLDNLESDFAISIGTAARIVKSINGVLFDAVLFKIGLSGRNWHMDFNFDLTTSEFKNFDDGNGAIELTLGYNFLKN